MRHMGVEGGCYEYKCDETQGECNYAGPCKNKFIPLDSGRFRRVSGSAEHVQQTRELRKHCERPYNLPRASNRYGESSCSQSTGRRGSMNHQQSGPIAD